MKNAIFAAAALVAGAVAQIGSAVVINKCDYEVYLYNTPSADGGYSNVDEVLPSNGQYTQQYTELTNGNGWSLKLSNSTSLANILQYEYTFHNDGTIWYDLSEVNGNPWDGNWEITSNTPTCAPKQQAYRYATDDAYGMQACPQAAVITVTLCSGESQDNSAASSASSSVAAASSSAAAASTTFVASTTQAAPSSIVVVSGTPTSALVTATTMFTSTVTSAVESNKVVVSTVTAATTTTFWTHRWGPPSKREAHAHQHAARHPHARD